MSSTATWRLRFEELPPHDKLLKLNLARNLRRARVTGGKCRRVGPHDAGVGPTRLWRALLHCPGSRKPVGGDCSSSVRSGRSRPVEMYLASSWRLACIPHTSGCVRRSRRLFRGLEATFLPKICPIDACECRMQRQRRRNSHFLAQHAGRRSASQTSAQAIHGSPSQANDAQPGIRCSRAQRAVPATAGLNT